MSATPDDWRVHVQKGDKLSVTATYDSKLASWYEAWDHGRVDGRRRHRQGPVRDQRERARHPHARHLAEDDNHAARRRPKHYVDETKLPSRVVPTGT